MSYLDYTADGGMQMVSAAAAWQVSDTGST